MINRYGELKDTLESVVNDANAQIKAIHDKASGMYVPPQPCSLSQGAD